MNDQNPYASPQSVLVDPASMGQSHTLAGRGARLAASIVDQLVAVVALLPMFPALIASGEGGDMDAVAMGGLGLGGLLFLGLLGLNLMWLAQSGQTVGKRVLGVKIVRMDGSPIGLGRIIGLRILPTSLLQVIPLVGGLIGLADVLFIFRDDRRCIHDLIADSQVVEA